VIRGILSAIEITILSILILATRCANYQDVFVAGNIYFTDADCYARMTRVRMCLEHPGLIIRHHDCSARLSHPRAVDFPEAIQRARNRSLRRAYFTAARGARRLVSLVVVEANETPISMGDADAVRDQSHSRSRNRTRQTRPSILVDTVHHDRDLR
jgi:hypothetical protein